MKHLLPPTHHCTNVALAQVVVDRKKGKSVWYANKQSTYAVMHTVPFKPPKPTHVSQASGKEKYWGEIHIFISSLKMETKIFK